MNFIDRIIAWNDARYDQDHNKALTFDLLNEEVNEFGESRHDVDKLDALVDIVYVAIGAMWKMGLNKDEIELAINVVCDSNGTKSVDKVPSGVKANTNKGKNFIPPEASLQRILNISKSRRQFRKDTLEAFGESEPDTFPENAPISSPPRPLLTAMEMSKKFTKHDAGKLQYSLIPPEAMKAMALVLTHGAQKYGPGNWKNVDDPNRYVDALYRHLETWRSGCPIDEDSGFNHMAHVLTNAAFLMYFEGDEL